MAGWFVMGLVVAWVLAVVIHSWIERRFWEIHRQPGALADRIALVSQLGTASGQAAAERVSRRRQHLQLLAHWRQRTWQVVGSISLLIGGLSLLLPDGLFGDRGVMVPLATWLGQRPLTALAGLGLPAGLIALLTSRSAFTW